ncbi:MAG: phage baseplate assembly protein V [Gammaproteobacteria bacterium]
MACGLVDTAANANTEEEPRFQGIAVAQVVSNLDTKGLGRVQIRLSWLAGTLVWARVAAPMAGLNYGTYFIPQPFTEVVVAFNNGDTADPIIIGSLWNSLDRPPALLPTDPTNKRVIRTPLGHEIEFNEATQSISITTSLQQQIVLDPSGIRMTTAGLNGGTTTTMDTAGNVSISASTSISLKAPTIRIDGATRVDIKSAAAANINGGAQCSIKAMNVGINDPI